MHVELVIQEQANKQNINENIRKHETKVFIGYTDDC